MAEQRRPFSLRIFLPDGSAEGLRLVEKSNWNGKGVVCPRPLLQGAKARPEFGKAGVYVLLGPAEDTSLPKAYIGEGDPILPRLEQHHAKKDFWTTVVFFVSKDDHLNKAHIQYLESRLISLARTAKRCDLDNGNQPALPSLSEMDLADAESFLEEMLVCLPVLGVGIFERPPAVTPTQVLLYLSAKGVHGTGYESSQGFVVMAGSEAVPQEVVSIHPYISDLRTALLQKEIFRPTEGKFVLTQDYTFSSPSLAAAVLVGSNANGRERWRDKSGRTLRSIQESQAGGV